MRLSISEFTADGRVLFTTRFLRLFAYGLLSVVLVLYLAEIGFSPAAIGLLLSLTLAGDTAISLVLTTRADRVGRRRMLILGALLMVFAAGLFVASQSFAVLLVAATLGVISPTGGEVGPFLSLEQAALSQFVPAERRTSVFAWYNLTGSVGTALGSLCGGLLVAACQALGFVGAGAYRPVLVLYGVLGLALIACFRFLSDAVEVRKPVPQSTGIASPSSRWGMHRSRPMVLKLSALFALDSFAGGFVLQSVLAYWLHLRFGAGPAALGTLFLAANILAGLSYIAAGWLAHRIGLINTMVFTHLPSNALLILVPLMPTFAAAVTLLLMRFAISQMDVPTRQAYVMAVVSPDERAAAAGVTGVARSIGAALSPSLATVFTGNPALAGLPFYLAGAIKIVYDLLLYRGFVHLKPEHERVAKVSGSDG